MTETVYSGEASDLRKAAQEVVANRESGSGATNPTLPAPDEHAPVEAPQDPTHDNSDRLSVRQAAEERMRQAAEADEEFERASQARDDEQLRSLMEGDDELRQRVLRTVEERDEINARADATANEAQAQLEKVKADAARREAEAQHRIQQLTAERQLIEANDQIGQYQRSLHNNFFETYPEAVAYMLRGECFSDG
jgi:hypothetical protein